MKKIIIECDEERYLNSDAIKIRKDLERVAKIRGTIHKGNEEKGGANGSATGAASGSRKFI